MDISNTNKIDFIYNKILDIESDIKNIKDDINEIKTKIDTISIQTTKMDKHVNFVTDVYETVEQPLNYVVNKWNNMFGTIDTIDTTNNSNKILNITE